MKRRKAREVALKMIFQMDVGKNSLQMAQNTLFAAKLSPELSAFVMELVEGVVARFSDMDSIVSQYISDWSIDRLSNIDKNILRMAIYELNFLREIPAVVTINEAIELAKIYGGDESGAFVNAVLDTYRKNREES